MTEYERIKQMHHQKHLLEENNKRITTSWQKARKIIKVAMENISQDEKKLLSALQLSIKALVVMQSMKENPPLKKIALDKMNGEPVWVVSYNQDGRWGIVDISDDCVQFITEHGIEREYWFDDRYIFRYRKVIDNYANELERYGIQDNPDSL